MMKMACISFYSPTNRKISPVREFVCALVGSVMLTGAATNGSVLAQGTITRANGYPSHNLYCYRILSDAPTGYINQSGHSNFRPGWNNGNCNAYSYYRSSIVAYGSPNRRLGTSLTPTGAWDYPAPRTLRTVIQQWNGSQWIVVFDQTKSTVTGSATGVRNDYNNSIAPNTWYLVSNYTYVSYEGVWRYHTDMLYFDP